MGAYLDKRYAAGTKKAWTWIARYQVGDSALSETIGYWTEDSRDPWRPRAYRGRKLNRMSESAARSKLREIDAAVSAGKGGRAVATPWEEWAQGVEARNDGTIAPTTLVDYAFALRLFGELTGCESPRNVDVAMAKRFVQKASVGRSVATINKYLGALCRVWNSEFPKMENPFRACRSERAGGLRRGKIADQDWHRMSTVELRKLLGVLDQRWQAIVLVAYTSGLRKHELGNLTWADADMDKMLVGVNPKRDTATTWAWSPKDHERRMLPLVPEAKMALMRLRGNAAGPYVFVEPKRYRLLLRGRTKDGRDSGREVFNNLNRTFSAACMRAKIAETQFHSLRKTCITNWLESGARGARVEPHEVQRLAGHSSIETTMRYYAKVAVEALDRARRASTSYVGRANNAG
jgi:integrase